MSDKNTTVSEGKQMLPTREAAKRVGFSSDYVSRLVREGRVHGSKIGGAWFVDEGSLRACVEGIELEKQVRAKLLKEERYREQLVRDSLSAQLVGAFQQRISAVGQTVSVLALSMVLAIIVHVAIVHQLVPYGFALTAFSVPSLTTNTADTMVASGNRGGVSSVRKTVLVDPASVAEVGAENSTLADVARGPLALIGVATSSPDTVSYLQSLFSDPVHITLSEDGVRGVVVPQLTDGRDGDAVDVLLIPNSSDSKLVIE